MRILMPLTYYRPYISGPIVHAENVAEELVRRGHSVSILTSKFDSELPSKETLESGIEVVRVPVVAAISKGVVMPTFLPKAFSMLGDHDVAIMQTPQLEAGPFAVLCRMRRRPCIITYQCDVVLPPSRANRAIELTLNAGHRVAARAASAITVYTLDYARHSDVLCDYLDKVRVVPPALDPVVATTADAEAFRERFALGDRPVVGICARFSAEKGFGRIIEAIPHLLDEWPDLCVVHAGDVEAVAGEAAYRRQLTPDLDRLGDHWVTTGVLTPSELAGFYRACDVTVLPSTNRTEAFGLVQIESMVNGTPVVASDLPGVRYAVQATGMGRIAPIVGSEPLAAELAEVLRNPADYATSQQPLNEISSAAACADGYEAMFTELCN